ncbi:MAG: hypothetical protein HY841_11835 [Bacteroidetes bacterium]|nr:hypothetical protein [Bacteroidota bacterium]
MEITQNLSAGRVIKKWQALGAHRTIKAKFRLCAMCLPLCRGLMYKSNRSIDKCNRMFYNYNREFDKYNR